MTGSRGQAPLSLAELQAELALLRGETNILADQAHNVDLRTAGLLRRIWSLELIMAQVADVCESYGDYAEGGPVTPPVFPSRAEVADHAARERSELPPPL